MFAITALGMLKSLRIIVLRNCFFNLLLDILGQKKGWHPFTGHLCVRAMANTCCSLSSDGLCASGLFMVDHSPPSEFQVSLVMSSYFWLAARFISWTAVMLKEENKSWYRQKKQVELKITGDKREGSSVSSPLCVLQVTAMASYGQPASALKLPPGEPAPVGIDLSRKLTMLCNVSPKVTSLEVAY